MITEESSPRTTVPRRPFRAVAVDLVTRSGLSMRRALVVVAVLLLLEVVTFHGYFSGSIAPQWDFYNQYNTEAWAWWRDGGVFHPLQWMPYAWGGYPAVLDVQNSSWYLPVGIAALFGPFTIHASAVVAALHVAFGALGMYALARSWRVRFLPSLLGLVIWFYAAGFYSNAQHLDIARAYAWVPWLLLVVGPHWSWTRFWRWPLGVLILWQGVLALYPGILVASVYVLACYVLVSQVIERPRLRRYLLPLAVASISAAFMTSLRYLPLYLTRGSGTPSSGGDTSVFSWDLLGTFLYPYGSDNLGNDLSMRSFFLAASTFVLLVLAPWKHRRIWPILAAALCSILLAFPFWPWHDSVRAVLPGMDLSRFTMSDFKPYLLLSLALLAVLGAQRLIAATESRVLRGRAPKQVGIFVALALVLMLFLVWAHSNDFDRLGWILQFSFLLVSAAVVTSVVLGSTKATAGIALLVVVAGGSGLTSQLSTTPTWQSDRLLTENQYFGASVSELVAQGKAREAESQNLTRRPARIGPAPDQLDASQALAPNWGRAFYTRELAVVAYVNLKGTRTISFMENDLFNDGLEQGQKALAFWSSPGILLAAGGRSYPSVASVDRCSVALRCGHSLQLVAKEYRTGHYVYGVTTSRSTWVKANEAYYPGWQVSITDDSTGEVKSARVKAGAGGEVLFRVPSGTSTVSMDYHLPGLRTSQALFLAGLLITLLGAVYVEFARRRRRRTTPAATRSEAQG